MHGVDAVSKETCTSVKRDLHMNQVDAGRDRATSAARRLDMRWRRRVGTEDKASTP